MMRHGARASIAFCSLTLALAGCGDPTADFTSAGGGRPAAASDKKIAFVVHPDPHSNSDNSDIYLSQADGSEPTPFLSSSAAEFYPEWSPTGDRMAFVSDVNDPGNVDVYVIDADGSNLTRVTDDPAIDTAPSWSPDGTRLAFSRNIDGQDEIVVTTLAGAETQLTDNMSIDALPKWSADGSQIAFLRNQHTQVDVWLMNADGSDQRPLTTDASAETSLAWAPDGSRIAVTRPDSQGEDIEIVLISLADGSVDQVTHDRLDQKYVGWAPTGERLVFASDRVPTANPGRAPSQLHVLDLDTGRQHPLGAMPRDAVMPSWRQ